MAARVNAPGSRRGASASSRYLRSNAGRAAASGSAASTSAQRNTTSKLDSLDSSTSSANAARAPGSPRSAISRSEARRAVAELLAFAIWSILPSRGDPLRFRRASRLSPPRGGLTVPVPRIPVDIRTPGPPQPLPRSPYLWPKAEFMEADGPVAMGGDFEPSSIISAYRAGVFPWPHSQQELLWFSPDPRAILPLDGLYVSRRLARTLRQGRFRVTLDAAFPYVVSEV